MSKLAAEISFTGQTTPIASYDSTKTNLGPLIQQYTGVNYYDKFAGPEIIGLARPVDAAGIPGIYPHVLTYSSTIDWVFLADIQTAAATRRIIWYEYNKNTSQFNYKGFITLTYPAATVGHTIRGFRMTRDLYTTGTAAVSGTAVTGTSSLWIDDRMCVGSRIGFGSTNPTQITTWYQISAIGANNSITLTSSAGTIPDGPYVIEDLRCLTVTTNTTVTNGGLFVAKGLRIEDFSNVGTTIPAATTVDNIKAVYWLADAATLTNTTAAGLARQDKVSWTEQRVYVLNVTGAAIYVYNVRAALTLAAGKDVTTNIIKTGNQVLTGVLAQTNNGRVAALSHGPGAGIECLYFATTTRIYRAAISGITNASVTWAQDAMVEVPPGGVNTFPATGAFACVEVSDQIDRLVITTTGAGGVRSYITRYNTNSDPFDHIFLIDDKSVDSALSDQNVPVVPSINAALMTPWSEGGILYLARNGTTTLTNHMYTIPIGAHYTYESVTNNVLITPKIATTSAIKYYKVYVSELKTLGTDVYSVPTEQYKIYARTSGIDDNSGAWTLLNDGDISNITVGAFIQFKFTFKIIGGSCIPARLLGVGVTYEDNTTDSHYEPSVANSSIASNRFAYRQSVAWGSNIPVMRIRLYNAVTGVLIIDDNTSSNSFGTFEYSTNNGSSWNAWSNSADAVNNYIRYTASSLPASTKIRSLFTIL